MGFFGVEHIENCIVERAEVGGDLIFEVTWEEAEGFASFDGWASEDDALDMAAFEFVEGDGHGEVGFSGSGWAEAKDQVVLLDGLDVEQLRGGFGGDGFASAGADEFDGCEV